MQKAMGVKKPDVPEEDLVDTLIAISVVSRRLAEKLRKYKEEKHEQNEGTVSGAR